MVYNMICNKLILNSFVNMQYKIIYQIIIVVLILMDFIIQEYQKLFKLMLKILIKDIYSFLIQLIIIIELINKWKLISLNLLL